MCNFCSFVAEEKEKKKYVAKQEENMERQEKVLKEMHNEKMSRIDRLLDIFESKK